MRRFELTGLGETVRHELNCQDRCSSPRRWQFAFTLGLRARSRQRKVVREPEGKAQGRLDRE